LRVWTDADLPWRVLFVHGREATCRRKRDRNPSLTSAIIH